MNQPTEQSETASAQPEKSASMAFCHEVTYLDGDTLSVKAVKSKPRETIWLLNKVAAQRDELLAALKLAWNDKNARFGVDKVSNRPISEIIRSAIRNAEQN